MEPIRFDLSILDQVIDSPYGKQQSELLDALQAHALAATEGNMSFYQAAVKNAADKNHFSYWFDKLVSSNDKTYNNTQAVLSSPVKLQTKDVGKMIGNAVPVRLGEIIGASFQNHLNQLLI